MFSIDPRADGCRESIDGVPGTTQRTSEREFSLITFQVQSCPERRF